MPYTIDFHRKAQKILNALPDEACERISTKIDQLAIDPYPPGCVKLVNYKPDGWRIRVG